MLTGECSADNDALHRLSHIQPGATNRRIERHHPMIEAPAHQVRREMSRQIIQDQYDTQRRFWIARWMPQPGLPAGAGRTLLFRRQFCSWVCLLDLGQHFGELRVSARDVTPHWEPRALLWRAALRWQAERVSTAWRGHHARTHVAV